MKQRTVRRTNIALWLPIVFLLLAADIALAQPGTAVSELLVDGAHDTRLDLYLDRIGVLLQPRIDSVGVHQVAAFLSATLTDRYADGFAVFRLGHPILRKDIVATARRLVRLRPGLAARAGMVVSLVTVYSPMIVPDEVIVLPRFGVGDSTVTGLLHSVAAVSADSNVYRPGQQLARRFEPAAPDTSAIGPPPDSLSFNDAFDAARRLRLSGAFRYVVPNFIHAIVQTGDPTAEPYFGRQWHLENTGQFGGTPDADIDAASAWSITQGSPDVIVAIHDADFDLSHPDLKDQLWTNPDEDCVPGAIRDDDHNHYYDDVHGWDFQSCYVGCGSPPYQDHCYACDFSMKDPKGCAGYIDDKKHCGQLEVVCVTDLVQTEVHGTAVAGIVAANGYNSEGMTGVAPGARLMLLRRALDEYDVSKGFDYARAKGASIINNSWKLTPNQVFTSSLRDAIASAATQGRHGLGCIVVFSMGDQDRDDCQKILSNDSIYDIKRGDGTDAVFAVSGSDNLDRKSPDTGFGDCMGLLAPSHGGTLHVATDDFSGDMGYNSGSGSKGWLDPCPSARPGEPDEPDDPAYTFCFRGTSAAAPMVSGAAALVLSINSTLKQPEVFRLLQDTADKVDDKGSTGAIAANYDPLTGFSRGVGMGSTYGWGRLNAYEAVRVAAQTSTLTAGCVDLFVRDNDLDWGNTEQPSSTSFESTRGTLPITSSVSMRIDASPASSSTPPSDVASFLSAPDEPLARGDLNRISVLVRNRGSARSGPVTVKLLWAPSGPAGSAPPSLPPDLWARFPEDPAVGTDWTVVGTTTITDGVPYSGASSTLSTGTDAAKPVSFDFRPPPAASGAAAGSVFLLIVDTPGDSPGAKVRQARGPLGPADFDVDSLVGSDNNISQKRFP